MTCEGFNVARCTALLLNGVLVVVAGILGLSEALCETCQQLQSFA